MPDEVFMDERKADETSEKTVKIIESNETDTKDQG